MITVTKTGWLITPESKTYNKVKADIVNENYTAYQPKISGTVLKTEMLPIIGIFQELNNSPLSGVSITANNGGGSTLTDASGYYEISVPYNWTGTVNVSLMYWSFSIGSTSYSSVITDQAEQDFFGMYVGLNGNGTSSNPYMIDNLTDFDEFADPNNAEIYWALGVYTKLMTDIDLSGRIYTTAVIAPDTDNQSDGFQGVNYFGVFEGNNYTIKNLSINANGANNDFLGLFGKAGVPAAPDRNPRIDNLGIKDTIISGSNSFYVGGLVGLSEGRLTNCYSTGIINGDSYVGGLVGVNEGNISFCYSNSNVNADFMYSGGLVGISAPDGIRNCYSTGNVSGVMSVGGLAGESASDIINCYSSSSVNGWGDTGGFVGVNCGYIRQCYSTGSLSDYSPDSDNGGFIGLNDGLIENSYWDVQTSNMTDGVGSTDPDPIGVTGKTTSEMMIQSTFTGWDFSDNDGDSADWKILREGEDYPRLAWQIAPIGDIAGLLGVDMADFAYLSNYWGLDGCNSGTDCGRADIDNNGSVSLPDLILLADDWLRIEGESDIIPW